jgi:hypothetical protein
LHRELENFGHVEGRLSAHPSEILMPPGCSSLDAHRVSRDLPNTSAKAASPSLSPTNGMTPKVYVLKAGTPA